MSNMIKMVAQGCELVGHQRSNMYVLDTPIKSGRPECTLYTNGFRFTSLWAAEQVACWLMENGTPVVRYSQILKSVVIDYEAKLGQFRVRMAIGFNDRVA